MAINSAAPAQCNPDLSSSNTDRPQEKKTSGTHPALLQADLRLSPSQGNQGEEEKGTRVLSQHSLQPSLKHPLEGGSQKVESLT